MTERATPRVARSGSAIGPTSHCSQLSASEARATTPERVSFHSLRKNAVEALERASVNQSEVALLIGHERGFTFSTYSPRGLDLPGLKRVVEQITYPGLDLRHILLR